MMDSLLHTKAGVYQVQRRETEGRCSYEWSAPIQHVILNVQFSLMNQLFRSLSQGLDLL